MEIVGMVIFMVVLLVGVISPFFGLPGTFIIVADALIYGLINRFQKITIWFLLLLLGMAVAGEIFEFFSNIFGAKHYGATRLGLIGAFLGGIGGIFVGNSLLPFLGPLLGGLIGAFAGAFLFELLGKEGPKKAITAGIGAFLGRVAAVSVKVFITIIMVVLIVTKVL
ncbi:MAG: DUF456 family protein [bacterium]